MCVVLYLRSLKYLPSFKTALLYSSQSELCKQPKNRTHSHSTYKERKEKSATGHIVSVETPNRSIDEDLRCSAHWGTKRFHRSPPLQAVSGLYRGWAALAVPVAPRRTHGWITGWTSIWANGVSFGAQADAWALLNDNNSTTILQETFYICSVEHAWAVFTGGSQEVMCFFLLFQSQLHQEEMWS